ncbi:MAG: spore coat U domain-containing protein [Myxococcota bacterium]|nr:spore coat U domain-containing protein [Myxococcota bacterium]
MRPAFKNALLAGGVLLSATLAYRATAAKLSNQTLFVSATVSDNCVVRTDSFVPDGYEPIVVALPSAANGRGSLTIHCTTGAVPDVTVRGAAEEPGRAHQGSAGATHAGFTLYQNSARNKVWGGSVASRELSGAVATPPPPATAPSPVAPPEKPSTPVEPDTIVATVTF